MTETRKKLIRGITILILLFVFAVLLVPKSSYEYQEHALPGTFDEFYQQLLEKSKQEGVRAGNEEKLVRYSPGKTPIAIVYVHGFGASRAEGELVMDDVAARLKANIFYVRLPGHGTTKEDHAKQTMESYLNYLEDVIRVAPQLGDKLVLVGTSFGGLLSTHLAANHDSVDALVVASPFYDFAEKGKMAGIMGYPGGLQLTEAVYGEIRDIRKKPEDPTDTRIDGYQNYWYDVQYYRAIQPLVYSRNYISKPDTFGRIKIPSLLLYYYEDEAHQDGSASVKAMLEAFAEFGMNVGGPNPKNKAVSIVKGDHILFSKWVRSDTERAKQEVYNFISTVFQ